MLSKNEKTHRSNMDFFLSSPKPIGIGTPYCESLYSYICRLAAFNFISTRRLIQGLNFILSEKVVLMSLKYIIGMNSETRKLVFSIEKLTKRENLRYMTALPLQKFALEKGLFNDCLAWCPLCYNDWREKGETIYHPLLWSFYSTPVCMIHQEVLSEECPYCKKKITRMPESHILGYCPRCNKWMGSKSRRSKKMDDLILTWQKEACCTIGGVISHYDMLSQVSYRSRHIDIRKYCSEMWLNIGLPLWEIIASGLELNY